MNIQSTPVLVVTADSRLQEATRRILAKHRAQVCTATNGLECLELLRRETPELVVLDDMLLWGGADGVLARITEDTQVPATNVLILTDEEDHSRWDGKPIIGYPSKMRLLAALEQELAKKGEQ